MLSSTGFSSRQNLRLEKLELFFILCHCSWMHLVRINFFFVNSPRKHTKQPHSETLRHISRPCKFSDFKLKKNDKKHPSILFRKKINFHKISSFKHPLTNKRVLHCETPNSCTDQVVDTGSETIVGR
jgi:hypothetical protein